MDLIDTLAERIGFSYTVYLVQDGNFGAKDKTTNQWNGLVRDLVDRVSNSYIFICS